MKKKFTGDELISSILEKFPESYEIFVSYGLHCMGCPASAFENLKDGAANHGFSEKEIQKLIDDLNLAFEEKK